MKSDLAEVEVPTLPTLMESLNSEIADVVGRVRSSLVGISNGRLGAGAGTIWDTDGLILTNAHVAGRGTPQVTLADGRRYAATLLARDEGLDLAALAIDATDLPAIALGESSRLQTGQLVQALGHTWGTVGAVTAGVVIGQGSAWPELPRSKREWIGISLNLRPGNSGGPLIDVYGRLVGINTVMTGPEAGFAVPVHVAKAFLHEAGPASQGAEPAAADGRG